MKTQTQSKMGMVIDVSIQRADGSLEHHGEIHNVIGNGLASSVNRAAMSPYTATVNSMTTKIEIPVDGTFSATGGTLTRASGTFDLTTVPLGNLFKLATGGQFYKTGAGSASSCPISKTITAAATSMRAFLTLTRDNTTGSLQSKSLVSMVRGLTSNVLSWATNTAYQFDPASSAYTLSRLVFTGNFGRHHFDLLSPIELGIGDQIVINSAALTYTYNSASPATFAVSPITGITGTGRIQWLRRLSNSNSAPNRIFLLSNANRINPIPNLVDIAGAIINPATFTTIETIIATGSVTPSSTANNMTEGASCFGNTAIGGTVKQIVWGTASEAHGVIEYDTPVIIAAAKVLTVGHSMQFEIEIP